MRGRDMRSASFRAILFASFAAVLCRFGVSGAQIPAEFNMPPGGHAAIDPGLRPSVGPFELSSADGASKVRIQLALQLRTTFESRYRRSSANRLERTWMEARRVRLILSGTVLRSELSYRLHLSTAPGSLELMDFHFDYEFDRQLRLRYGQFKVPFTRYRIQSFQRLTFADWSLVTRYFGAERQMGFAVHNGYEESAGLSYAAGLFTGVNARASHAVGLAELYDMALSSPSDLAQSGPKAKFHPELFVHVAYGANGIRVESDSDGERCGLRCMAALGTGWDLDPVTGEDFTGRIAPELLVKYRGCSVSGIGYAGYGRTDRSSRVRPLMHGLLLRAAWRMTGSYEISIRYAVVDFRDALVDDVVEVTQTPADEQIRLEQEATAGFNIYIDGHSLKWQNDATLQRHSSDLNARNDIVIRSQL